MPQTTNVTCTARTWTLITNSDCTALRVVNRSQYGVFLKATVGTTPPTDANGALSLRPNETLAGDLTLVQMFGGTTGANRVYAFAPEGAVLSVSHA
jgi:hypothetical protein